MARVDGQEALKIDNSATEGLSGTSNSLAYRVHEIEKHLHNWESWFGLAASPTADHKADRVGSATDEPFQIDAGNDAWGSWVQLLGADDTPARTAMAYYDVHRIQFIAAERDETYFLQLGVGATGAAALSAGTYTEVVFKPASNLIDAGPVYVLMSRAAAGSLLWARCFCRDQNTATLDFYIGIHEYAG